MYVVVKFDGSRIRVEEWVYDLRRSGRLTDPDLIQCFQWASQIYRDR